MVPIWLMNLYHGLVFTSPAFFANSVAVYTSGLGRIDRGKNFSFDGYPILGSHKTIGGAIGAILGGGLLGITAPYFFPDIYAYVYTNFWGVGFILGFGAILGDAIGSFIKRRFAFSRKPGASFPLMDQIGFIVVAFLLIRIFVTYPWSWFYMVVPFTLVGHLLSNRIAWFLGWKDVPW